MVSNETHPPARTDEWSDAIVSIAKMRDRRAYRSLFDHFAPRVKAFSMRSGLSADLAEEIAQETLITVWRKATLYDPAKASASTWIFTICRNKRIDRLRKEKRLEIDANDPAFVADETDSPDETISRFQNVQQLRLALHRLPENQRDVLQLSFLEEYTHTEIAERLDLPLGTIKSRIRLAMAKLRELMDDPDR